MNIITLGCLTNIQKRSTRPVKEQLFMVEWIEVRDEVEFEACGLCQRKGS